MQLRTSVLTAGFARDSIFGRHSSFGLDSTPRCFNSERFVSQHRCTPAIGALVVPRDFSALSFARCATISRHYRRGNDAMRK
jgi:hypothetical protein